MSKTPTTKKIFELNTKNNIHLISEWTSAPFKHYQLFCSFVRRDINAKFAGSSLGLTWTILTPLFNILIYLFVFSVILKIKVPAHETGTASFTIFLLSGLLPWLYLAECLNRGSTIIIDNASLVTKVSFPVQLLPWSLATGVATLHSIGIIILLVFLIFSGYGQPSWIMAPVVLFFLFGFTVGIIAFLGTITVFLRDIREIVSMITQLWFYLTPILYPISMVPGKLQPFMLLNPVIPFINAFRECLFTGVYWSNNFTMALVLSLLSCLAGGCFFMKIKPAFGDVL